MRNGARRVERAVGADRHQYRRPQAVDVVVQGLLLGVEGCATGSALDYGLLGEEERSLQWPVHDAPAGALDMFFEQRNRLAGVAPLQRGDEAQVLLHRRDQPRRRDDALFELDQPHPQGVDAVDLGHDLVAHSVDHAVVQAPVERLGIVEQGIVDRSGAGAGAAQDVAVAGLDRIELALADAVREMRDGLALDHAAQLERVADQLEVDMRDLQATLRHGPDQATGLEPRNHLAHSTQRHVEQGHQLALRNELAAADAATEDLLREPLVGPRPLAERFARHGIGCRHTGAAPGGAPARVACGWRSWHRAAHGRTTPFLSTILR